MYVKLTVTHLHVQNEWPIGFCNGKKKIPSDGPLPWPSVDARLVPNAPLVYPLTCLNHGTCATYPRAAVTVCTRTTCDLARAATHARRAWHTSRRMPCTCHKARYAPHVTCSHNTCGAYVTVPPCTCQAMECQALSCNLCRGPIFNHKTTAQDVPLRLRHLCCMIQLE